MNLFQAITMRCKDATYLNEKKRGGKLTMSEGIGLSFHLFICKFCRLFFKQVEKLESASAEFSKKEFAMNADKKAKLQSEFDLHLKK